MTIRKVTARQVPAAPRGEALIAARSASSAPASWRRDIGQAAGPDEFASLLDALYGAPLESQPWASFVRLLGSYLRCGLVAAVLRWPDADDGAVVSSRPELNGLFAADGVLARRFRDLPPGEIQFLEGADLPFDGVLGIDIADGASGAVVRFRCIRFHGEDRFGAREREAMERFAPRLAQSVRLQALVSGQRLELDELEEVCHELVIGKLVLDARSVIVRANGAAAMMIEARDGMVAVNGVFRCVDREAQTRFVRLAEQTIAIEPDGESAFNPQILYLRRPSGQGYWSVAFRRGHGRPMSDQECTPLVHVLIKNASYRPSVTQRMLEQMFGLTPAEAKLAQRLTDGETLYEAAENCGISRNTARVHLTAIFSKMHVNRQAQLVSLVLSRLNSGWTIPRADAREGDMSEDAAWI